MAEKIYTVERLARLCGVDRETVRRWRNRGLKGTVLESVNTDTMKGKPLMFTEQAIRDFVKANPKVMTLELEKELAHGNEEDVYEAQIKSHGGAASYGSTNVTRSFLETRKNDLTLELQEIEKILKIIK